MRPSARGSDTKPSDLCFSSHCTVCSLPGGHMGYNFPRHLWLMNLEHRLAHYAFVVSLGPLAGLRSDISVKLML